MRKHLPSLLGKTFLFFFAFLLGGFFIQTAFAGVWSAPTNAPPNGNPEPPLNTSAAAQVKTGGIWVGSFGVDGGAFIGGNVGIGTTSSSSAARLHIVGDALNPPFVLSEGYGLTTGGFFSRVANGTQSAPADLTSGNTMGTVAFGGYASGWVSHASAGISAFAAENWTPNANGTYLAFYTTKNNTPASASAERMRIDDAGNVSIGTAGQNQKLDVAGQIHATGDICTDVGGGSGKCLGALSNATNYWTLSGSGTNIYNNNSGNVGIGTSNPDGLLTVSNNASPSATSGIYNTNGAALHLAGADGANTRIALDSFGPSAGAISVLVFRHSNGTAANPTPLLGNDYISIISNAGYDGSGMVGIPTIVGRAAENWTPAAHGTYLTFHTAAIGSNGSLERVRITDAGNVGIGTRSPSTRLHILGNELIPPVVFLEGYGGNGVTSGSAGGTSGGFFSRVANGTQNAPSNILSGNNMGSASFGGYASGWVGHAAAGISAFAAQDWTPGANGSYLSFYTTRKGTPASAEAEVMRIDDAGNVGIGTTNPGSKLQIYELTDSKPGGIVAATKSILKLSRSGTLNYSYNESAEFRIGHGGPSYYGSRVDLFINGPLNTNNIPDQQVMTWLYNGNVGIAMTNPQSTLDVNGHGHFSQGVGPPYVSYSNESHESIRKYAKTVYKGDTVMEFWNATSHRMEVYVISENKFYTLDGQSAE